MKRTTEFQNRGDHRKLLHFPKNVWQFTDKEEEYVESCVYLCPDGDGIIKKKRKKGTIADNNKLYREFNLCTSNTD